VPYPTSATVLLPTADEGEEPCDDGYGPYCTPGHPTRSLRVKKRPPNLLQKSSRSNRSSNSSSSNHPFPFTKSDCRDRTASSLEVAADHRPQGLPGGSIAMFTGRPRFGIFSPPLVDFTVRLVRSRDESPSSALLPVLGIGSANFQIAPLFSYSNTR